MREQRGNESRDTGRRSLGAEGGGQHSWSSGGMLGAGEVDTRAGPGPLIVSEMHSHCPVGCPWEENWTKGPCVHSGSECAS